MARSRKKTYSASLSWHRLKTFLSLTSELHHWYRVADPVLQSRHQKEDKYQVNAFQRLSTLKTNKFITACFSVCSICKCSFSESALCTPSHTSRAEPDKRSLSKTSKHIYVVKWNLIMQNMLPKNQTLQNPLLNVDRTQSLWNEIVSNKQNHNTEFMVPDQNRKKTWCCLESPSIEPPQWAF